MSQASPSVSGSSEYLSIEAEMALFADDANSTFTSDDLTSNLDISDTTPSISSMAPTTSVSSSSSSNIIPTPSATLADLPTPSSNPYPSSSASTYTHTHPHLRASALLPGHTYLIKSRTYSRFLTLSTSHSLSLSRDPEDSFDRWECTERNGDGYLGLRNAATGTYLGHDFVGTVVCREPHHKGWEGLVAEARGGEGGGYVISMPHWWMLCPVGVRRGGDGFEVCWEGRGAEGETWEFLRIH